MFSNITVWPLKDQSGTIQARGRVTVADAMNVNFTVMKGKNGLFVSLPSHKGKDADGNDKWYNDVFIEDKAVFADLNKQVIAAMENTDTGSQGEASGPTNQETGGDSIPW